MQPTAPPRTHPRRSRPCPHRRRASERPRCLGALRLRQARPAVLPRCLRRCPALCRLARRRLRGRPGRPGRPLPRAIARRSSASQARTNHRDPCPSRVRPQLPHRPPRCPLCQRPRLRLPMVEAPSLARSPVPHRVRTGAPGLRDGAHGGRSGSLMMRPLGLLLLKGRSRHRRARRRPALNASRHPLRLPLQVQTAPRVRSCGQ